MTTPEAKVALDQLSYQHRIKCMKCGLHYIVCSWHPDWPTAYAEHRDGGYCPECGNHKGYKLVWGGIEMDEFIFEQVPGDFQPLPPAEAKAAGFPVRDTVQDKLRHSLRSFCRRPENVGGNRLEVFERWRAVCQEAVDEIAKRMKRE